MILAVFVGGTLLLILFEEIACSEGASVVLWSKGSGFAGPVDVGGSFEVELVLTIWAEPKPSLSVNIIWSPSEIPHSVKVELFGFVIAVGGKLIFTVIYIIQCNKNN